MWGTQTIGDDDGFFTKIFRYILVFLLKNLSCLVLAAQAYIIRMSENTGLYIVKLLTCTSAYSDVIACKSQKIVVV